MNKVYILRKFNNQSTLEHRVNVLELATPLPLALQTSLFTHAFAYYTVQSLALLIAASGSFRQ